MKRILTTGWTFSRILRLVAGLAVFYYAIVNHDQVIGIAGGLMIFMGIMNIGICGAGSCDTPRSKYSATVKPSGKEPENISYEEVR